MLNFEEDTTSEGTKFDSLTGGWVFTDSPILNKIGTVVAKMIRWTIIRNMLYVAFIAMLALAFGYTAKDKKLAEEMASHAVNDNPIGMFDDFIKAKNPKIKLTNSHPVYSSEIIKEWEEEYDQKFAKLFQYITIKNTKGLNEDLFVMRKAAYSIDDKSREAVPLDRSTMVGTSAKNVCEDYFGEIPTNYQKKFFDKRRHFRIRNIKDELTQENDDGKKLFRCVINQETINDLLYE